MGNQSAKFNFEKRVKQFCDLAYARHRIYVLKEIGTPKPWTEDPILRDNYFCNVFRRIDKTSVWLEENVIKRYKDHERLWAMIIAGRFISRISTYKELEKRDAWADIMKMQRVLRTMQVLGEKIITNAFVVNSGSSSGFTDKVTYLFRTIKFFNDLRGGVEGTQTLDEYLRTGGRSMENVYHLMQTASGVGPFMAYQYTVDFAYSERYLQLAPDMRTWMSLGIGSRRGLNRMHGKAAHNDLRKNIPDYMPDCRTIFDYWNNYVDDTLDKQIDGTYHLAVRKNNITEPTFKAIEQRYLPFYSLTMSDVQHWLCEYDKFLRGGSKKRKYYGKGETA